MRGWGGWRGQTWEETADASVEREDRAVCAYRQLCPQSGLAARDADAYLLSEWPLPSMILETKGTVWEGFLVEVSCCFHFSLSVLASGGSKCCLDTCASTCIGFSFQEKERVLFSPRCQG